MYGSGITRKEATEQIAEKYLNLQLQWNFKSLTTTNAGRRYCVCITGQVQIII